jgi:predicted HicB family RNase H-like nuclease
MGNKTTDYKRQFNAEKYDRLEITVPKGKKPELQTHAQSNGESLNGFVNRAIDETLERDRAGGDMAHTEAGNG